MAPDTKWSCYFVLVLVAVINGGIVYFALKSNWVNPFSFTLNAYKNLSVPKPIRLYQNVSIVMDNIPKEPFKWHLLPDKFDRLDENYIYKQFSIKKPDVLQKVNIILIVSSAPVRFDRRRVIRETWWNDCKSSPRVSIRCIFLTDLVENSTDIGNRLNKEVSTYGDVFFQKLSGGYDFGKRFLYHMVWAMENYNFDYFMRMDDDYFLCMEKFLLEVPIPPRTRYHWGWVHCVENIVRPEESIILLSRDLIEIFLGQDPDTILCNNWADQMIGIWNEVLKLPKFYRHDSRLHHDPPAQYTEEFKKLQNVCHKYIGIHGSYPVQMRLLWQHRGSGNGHVSKTLLDDYSRFCQFISHMDWKMFQGSWKTEPKLCKDNPDWGGHHGSVYIGRQGN